MGALVLKDSGGNVFATAYLQGNGGGPPLTSTSTPATHSGWVPAPSQSAGGPIRFSPVSAVGDGLGNLFVADAFAQNTWEGVCRIPNSALPAQCGSIPWTPVRGYIPLPSVPPLLLVSTVPLALRWTEQGTSTLLKTGPAWTRTTGTGPPMPTLEDAAGGAADMDSYGSVSKAATEVARNSSRLPSIDTWSQGNWDGVGHLREIVSVAVDGAGNVYIGNTGHVDPNITLFGNADPVYRDNGLWKVPNGDRSTGAVTLCHQSRFHSRGSSE